MNIIGVEPTPEIRVQSVRSVRRVVYQSLARWLERAKV